MANLIPLDEENQHRTRLWGSTNPAAVIGTDESQFTKWGVFVEKTMGMTLDMSHMTAGKDFEQGVISSGVRRLQNKLQEGESPETKDFLAGASVEPIKSRAEGSIVVKDLFTAEEIEEHGLDRDEVLPSNASPDFGFYAKKSSRKPFALGEAKLRVNADSKMMDQQPNDPIPGLPGNGKPWYGEEFTCEVLPKEYDQCQWHLKHYPGCDRVYVFITFCMKPEDGRIYVVMRDEDRIKELERAIVLFNHYHVKTGVEPHVTDLSDHCKWYQKTRKQIYPDLPEANQGQIDLALEWAFYSQKASKWKKKADGLQAQIIQEIGENAGMVFGDLGKVTYKEGKGGTRRFYARGFDKANASRDFEEMNKGV